MKSIGRKVGGLALLAIAGLLVIFIGKHIIVDFPIWLFGTHKKAVVDNTWFEMPEGDNSDFIDIVYFISYKFTDINGEQYNGESSLGESEFLRYRIGSNIDIVYLAINPSNNRVDDTQYILLYLCAYVPFILVIWASLISGLRITYSEFNKKSDLPWLKRKE